MLKRLKIKFVVVIMAIVTLLFGAIFGIAMHLTKQNIEAESIQQMRDHAFHPHLSDSFYKPNNKPDNEPDNRPDYKPGNKPDNEPDNMPEKKFYDKPDNIRLPLFTVNISENGEITAFGGDYYDLSDEEMLRELVDIVYADPEETGIISEYDLRFLKNDTDKMRSVVFTDVSKEKSMIKEMVRNLLIIGLIGYAVFFVISLILAAWMTKPVEKTWNEQKQFIADASHELKTPLTVIMTNAEMLSDKSYAESDRKNLTQNILSTSKRMRGLVESLLELARLDNNRSAVKFDLIDYSKLINDCILPFEPLFYENKMELSVDIDSNISVEGDKDKLRQVMTILLDNALKYYESDHTVNIKLKRQASHCMITVSGKGEALSRDDCKNIFKRFYRVDKARNDGHSYGLGLSIAESIINEHNGRIWAESGNGYNSFYVSLTTK